MPINIPENLTWNFEELELPGSAETEFDNFREVEEGQALKKQQKQNSEI